MTMVAIMAIAGGAFAATTTTNSTNTIDGTGFAGGTSFNFGGGVCNSVANTTVTCGATLTLLQSGAFVTDSQTGTGTGLAGGMPAQVSYSPNLYGAGLGGYASGVGPQTGYQLSQTLFGMCAFSGGVQGNCPKFVPTAAAAGANTIAGLLIAEGGGNAADGGAGTVASSTIPSGTANFNEATFVTGLVGGAGVAAGTFTNVLSQKTFHHSVIANGTGASDGDFIDQRLAQVIGTAQTLAQSTTIGASSGGIAVVASAVIGSGSVDASWIGNVDPYVAVAGGVAPTVNPTLLASYAALNAAGAFADNGGAITQGIADNNSGGFGDYGQMFTNDDMSVTNALGVPQVAQVATIYAATGATTVVPGGTINVLP